MRLAAALLGLLCSLVWAQGAMADRHGRVAAAGGVALGGFDPVAYFRDGTATPGDPAIVLRWRGLRWHFASGAHRGAFEANPTAYLPQFGGHCPVSLADGHPRAADPRHWAIVDGRLYITADAGDLARFLNDTDRLRRLALAAWSRPGRIAGGD